MLTEVFARSCLGPTIGPVPQDPSPSCRLVLVIISAQVRATLEFRSRRTLTKMKEAINMARRRSEEYLVACQRSLRLGRPLSLQCFTSTLHEIWAS